MDIRLRRAELLDAKRIHEMQIRAFGPLLEKYRDYDTSPGAETEDRIIERLKQTYTDYYLIEYRGIEVGAIRIVNLVEKAQCRISPIFILQEFQNMGIAQAVFEIIEDKYKPNNGWLLNTIMEEEGNCHLYEKIGYRRTGKVKSINERTNIVFYEKLRSQ